MSLRRLVFRNLMRHPVRSSMTGLAAVVATYLLIFLRSMLTTLDDAVQAVATNRIVTQSAVSLFVNLPLSYKNKIERIEGVESVTRYQWFGGVYRDPSNFFAQFAVDPPVFLEQYDECVISEDARTTFLSDRRACIVGRDLADKFGFKVGQTIPLLGTIFARDEAWEFTVAGIYSSTRANFAENELFFNFEYLRETLEAGEARGPEGVGVFVVKIADDGDPTAIGVEIDSLFSGGPQRTRTQSESAFQAGFVTMLGNIPSFLGWIGGAILFALVLTLVNAMLISGEERMRDVGLLKALGFGNYTCALVLLSESMALSLGGGLMGILLAAFSVSGTKEVLGGLRGVSLSGYNIRDETLIAAFLVVLAVGLVGGIMPALRASRLRVSEALVQEK